MTEYSYLGIGSLTWNSVPIAPTGSIGPGDTVALGVTVRDTAGHTMPGVHVNLDKGTPAGAFDSGAGGSRCPADASGAVWGTYRAATVLPTWTITDTITASTGLIATHSASTYTCGAPAALIWSATPIARTGAIGPGATTSLTLTVVDADGDPLPWVLVHVVPTATIGSFDLPDCHLGTCTSDRNGEVSMTYHSPNMLPIVGATDTITASAGAIESSTSYTYGKVTVLTYTGTTAGDHSDAATLAATLVEQTGSVPVPGRTVTFVLDGTETCSATTNASGRASCPIIPLEPAGAYTVTASFAGDGAELASSTSAAFAVQREEASLALGTIPAFVARGSPLTLTATLTDPIGAAEREATASPIAGKPVVFAFGTGATAQTCTGTTTASGVAACTISAIAQPLGPASLSATFTADAYHQGAAMAGGTTVFTYLGRGAFVVGDRSAVVGATVTFWSSSWANANKLSGGSPTAAFKGFASTLSSTPPVAGGTWTTSGGSSAAPPATAPSYIAVIVTSRITKSGSLIASASTTRIAIVAVNAGYDPATGSPGTGRLLGFLP